MRLHRLEVEGFGPFRTRQTVDFDEFATDGIFLIGGRTGAGKSSLLDAVCFALYGGVPRFEAGDKRLRSDHCDPDDPTEVVLEFSAREERWRVSRSPEYPRPKKRGDGVTVEPARAMLERATDDGWVGVASRAVDVGTALYEILPLTQQQFLQVILLAQNRFARFLLAKNDERQALLRSLFGTRRFADYEKALDERRKKAESEWSAAHDGILLRLTDAEGVIDEAGWGPGGDDSGADAESDPVSTLAACEGEEPTRSGSAHRGRRGAPAEPVDAWHQRLDAVRHAQARGAYRVETMVREQSDLEAALARADAERESVRAQRDRQVQRDRSRLALEELEAEAGARDEDRVVLRAAQQAEAVRHVVESAQRGAVDAERAAERAADARGTWDAVLAAVRAAGMAVPDERAEWSQQELEALIAQWTRESGACEDAAIVEATLSRDEQQREAAAAALAHAEERLSLARDERTALPAALRRLDEQTSVVRAHAGSTEALEAKHSAIEDQVAAARDAERLAEELATAEREDRARNDELAVAVARVGDLYARRHSGMAGELSALLVAGEPCSVCGSTEHPAPAAAAEDPVGGDDIERAETARERAMAEVQASAAVMAKARETLAAAVARSGGRSVAELSDDLAAARAALDDARAAAADLARLESERAELTATAERLDRDVERLSDAVADERESVARLTAVLDAARTTVDVARGPFGSVQERIDALTGLVAAARGLAQNLADLASASASAKRTAGECALALDGSGFADAEEALAALRDEADRALIDERLRAYDTALSAERARLLERELEALPEEPVDVDSADRAVEGARAAWTAAMARTVEARGRAARLAEAIERVEADGLRLARLGEEYETIDRLSRTVAGKAPNTLRMSLETFVLAAELEEIVDAANLRLAHMSQQRYRLSHTDALAARGAASGLGIEVIDAFTGRSRPAQSLSGGETFLASLALALGLAEVVTRRAGGIRLDTLFVDEGFGSLDEETLEIAMQTLDELRQGGRTVGLISHVETMKDQIPAQLVVRTTAAGDSEVTQRHPAGAGGAPGSAV